jgi:hypothetical protein
MNDVLMRAKRITAAAVAIIVGASAVAYSLLSMPTANAATLTSRSALLSTSEASSSGVTITFSYTLPTTGTNKQGIVYEFCTTPQAPTSAIASAACTAPGWTLTGNTHVAQTGWPTNGTAFAVQSGDSNACTETTNSTKVICYNRTQATTGGGAVTHQIGGITFNATFQTVYIRILTFNTNDFTGGVEDVGTVAVAVVRQLNVTGRVAENLNFCVYALDDAAAEPANCGAAPTAVDIDLGIIPTGTPAPNTNNGGVSPVPDSPPNSIGNDDYGILQVNTNAVNGIAVVYFPDTQAGTNQTRNFRVSGATCNASEATLTDECFQGAATTGTTFNTAGDERFGMHIPCIHGDGATNNLGSGGSGSGSSGGTVNSSYDADGTVTESADCENTDSNINFAWDSSGTAVPLVHSTTVVDNELVKIRFGARAAATTPTGVYAAVVTYIATPTF